MGDRHLRLVQPNQQQGRQNEVFNEMLRGYATMLLAAGRDRGSVGKLLQMLRGFVVWADAWPWEWTAQDIDEWSADMRDRELALSTLRNRQGAVRRFCEYAVNPQYPWLERTAGRQPQSRIQPDLAREESHREDPHRPSPAWPRACS
jgi:integrase/recombinase XerC